jgi:hypothetical protein
MQASDGGLADTERRMPNDANPSAGSDLRLQRILKLVVAGLAILIFAGLAAVVGRVIYLASPSSTQPSVSSSQPAASPTLAIRPGQSLQLPAGAQVRSISISGNRLAVHYEAAGATGIAVLDLQTGQMVTDVAVEPKSDGNGAPPP